MAYRAIYVWKLAPIVAAEGSVSMMVNKARRARITQIWVKIAEGRSRYRNVTGSTAALMHELVRRCHDKGIEVWGWHVPRCATETIARREAEVVQQVAAEFELDGIIADAEDGPSFFIGDLDEAKVYADAMRAGADALGKPLAISSHDIPQNFPSWVPKFNAIAAKCDLNFPQVYYGGSPSVENRLRRAENGNSHLDIPFVPVGAAWIGPGGGCESASACAERAREFIRLVHDRGYEGYSFWHWAGAPLAFWEVLNKVAP